MPVPASGFQVSQETLSVMYIVYGKLLELLPTPNKLLALAMVMGAMADSNPVSIGSAMVMAAAISDFIQCRMAPYRGKHVCFDYNLCILVAVLTGIPCMFCCSSFKR